METLKKIALLIVEAHQKKEYRPVAVALITNAQGRVLLVQSAMNPDNWGLPQGGIESDEEVLTALLREIGEETGISPQELNCERFLYNEDLDAEPERKDKRGFSKGKRYFFFALRYLGNETLHCDPGEIRDYRWAAESDIPRILATTRAAKRRLTENALRVFFTAH